MARSKTILLLASIFVSRNNPKSSFPSSYKALVGYEHMVPAGVNYNAILPVMSVGDIKGYSLERLEKKKRNQIRRGLERIEVKEVSNLNQIIKESYEINISALSRQNRVAKGYPSNFKKWQKEIQKTFNLPGREMWGAFLKNKLVAYLRSYFVEDTIFITNTMSHTDYLSFYPNDALLFSYILHCKEKRELRTITLGLWCEKQSLNKYKEQMGFRRIDFPLFRYINPLLRPIVSLTRYKHYLNYGK